MEGVSEKLQYLSVLMLMITACSFAAFNLIASKILGERAPTNPIKDEAYECGMPVLSPARMRFSVKFYIVAVLFILFDVDVVFVYPWAVAFDTMPNKWWWLVLMLAFLEVFVTAWYYCYKKGALDWET